jgi:hypothetical protein
MKKNTDNHKNPKDPSPKTLFSSLHIKPGLQAKAKPSFLWVLVIYWYI